MIASIRETRVALKGPLETPVGFGEKSANVTLRKLFETHVNYSVKHCDRSWNCTNAADGVLDFFRNFKIFGAWKAMTDDC